MFRKITNFGQNADNLLKLNDALNGCCPPPSGEVCQYSVVLPTANAVNNIIITHPDGTTETVNTGFPATGAANVVEAIKAALASVGYEDDTDAVSAVTSETSGTNTIYRITGDMTVVSMRHNSATDVTATALCDRIRKCVYSLDWGGDAGTTQFVLNGTGATLASFTLAGSTAAQVQAAIIALANWPTTATINVTETATAFDIRITDIWNQEYSLDGTDFTAADCAMGYIAA